MPLGPTVEEWVLGTLGARGPQTVDQLAESLPKVNWGQLFLAIDRLRRQGDITLRSQAHGDYLIVLANADFRPPECRLTRARGQG